MDERLRNSEILPMIRKRVKERLIRNAAFNSLPAEKRASIAYDTVKALHYIVGGEDGTSRPASMTLGGNNAAFAPTSALAGPVLTPVGNRTTAIAGPTTGGQPAAGTGSTPATSPPRREQRPGFGESAREGGQTFTDTIADVNFPAFVGGLIDGVFNSIVNTSIKQMEAYAEMVKNVSKSVDQYMKDNVSENNARDYLADKYPDHLQVDISGDKPTLKPKEGYDDNNMPDFFADLGLKAPITSLDDDNVEEELVPAARRRIAMDRQQLLATMVMMGVNRLVVTNGTIEASCMFELDTTDARRRAASRTTTADFGRTNTSESGSEGGVSNSAKRDMKWDTDHYLTSGTDTRSHDDHATWYSKGAHTDTAKFNITTASSNSTEETINLHAQLTGKVKVNFKSDYFPMEKMVDVLQINQIKEKTAAGAPPAQPLPPPPPPPMPAMPALPGAPVTQPAPAPAPVRT
jgi:hypothetical protein